MTASDRTADLGQLGRLVGDYDLCLLALKARNRKAADPALVARRRRAAGAALGELVAAWRRFESLYGCESAASGESPRAAQEGRQCPADLHAAV